MTTDPRVDAVAREMHRLEYGGAIDWDADGSLHSAFYLAAESILAAADAALADAPSGFFAGLTDQQQADALAYRGPENHGRDAPGGDAGPYTCTRCTQATWNDDDLCDACRGGDDA